MDTEASSTIETATVSQAGVPSCADQRRTGIAFSCLLGAFCGLYLDYVLKNGASMGPTLAIFYWLLFIIASGFFIERNAFKGGWFSKESLWLLLPPLVVIVTFVAPPLLMTIASGSFSPMWTLALSLFSVLILVFTPPFILIACEAKPTLQHIVTTIITTDENEISNVGKRVAAAWQAFGIVVGIVQACILFFTK